MRELQNRIQTIRKEMGLEFTDRIRVRASGSDKVRRIVQAHGEAVAGEVLAIEVAYVEGLVAGGDTRTVDVEGEAVVLAVTRVA